MNSVYPAVVVGFLTYISLMLAVAMIVKKIRLRNEIKRSKRYKEIIDAADRHAAQDLKRLSKLTK